MDIGMLWRDGDQSSAVPDKVVRAANHYRKKYGKLPNLCVIHPGMLNQQSSKNPNPDPRVQPLQVGQIRVLVDDQVLPDHLWIGVRSPGAVFSWDE